jgi:hypothetical protein
MIVNLKEICGKQTITREEGKKINELIVQSWNKEDKIVIEFSNILIASVSFLDEAFGKLAFDYEKEVLVQKLSFNNIEEYDRVLLNDILLSRYHQKQVGANGYSRLAKKRRIPQAIAKKKTA